MGLPINKTVDAVEEIETATRKSEGTIDNSKVDAEGHARDIPTAKVAKGKSWISEDYWCCAIR